MKTLVFSGGHHTSSLAVAIDLKAKGWKIIWFGHKYSMQSDTSPTAEFLEVTAADIDFIELKGVKIYRSINPFKLVQILVSIIATTRKIYLLNKTTPVYAAVSFGGYLAVPLAFAAWFNHIPVITHEQTITIGWANKLVSRLSAITLLTWPQSQRYISSHSTVVGLPLRSEFLNIVRKPKNHHKPRPVIYITGGKQGSHALNSVVFNCLNQLLKNYTVIHQTGNNTQHNDHLTAAKINHPNYQTFTYSSQSALSALESADVVITRSGAHMTYELLVLRKKCVVIPLPNSSHSEQHRNAQLLFTNGNATILNQQDLTPDTLFTSISDRLISIQPKPVNLPLDSKEKCVEIIEKYAQKI